ncbi:MFS transporter, partial [Pradoshia sp.]
EEINLAAAASFFFVIYAASLLITRPFTGRWFDLRGENFVIYPSLLLYAVSLLLLGGSMNSGMLLVAGAIMGIGLGTFQSSAQTIAIKEAPAHRVGLATSTFFVMYDIGIGTGPFLQGLYIPYVGYRGLYFTMGAIAFIGIVMYYFAHGRSSTVKSRSHVLRDQVQ